MANNTTDKTDDTKAIVPYSNEINECQLHIVFSIECIEAKVLLQNKLIKHTKHQKQVCYFMRNANAILKNEIKLDQQKKESLLVALESNKSRMIELNKQLLLAKEGRQNMIENIKNIIKKYEEHWITCKNRFESIHFIKRYFEVNNKIETVKGNISSLIIETKNLCNDINFKKTELSNLDKKYVIELADYMIHKRPAILKLIYEKRNEIKMLVKEKENNNFLVKNALIASPTKKQIEAKKISVEDIENLPRNMDHDTSVLPKLHLLNMDSVSIEFNQIQKVYKNTAPFKRSLGSYSTFKCDVPKKAKVAENFDEEHVSTYFTSPTKIDQAKKYSDKKLINILDDVKLDTTGTYNIISKLKPYQLHDVNVIKAGISQSQQKEIEPNDKVKELETEVIEEIDLTKKVSQDIILPPTQFIDLERNSQEKRVTFNTVITIEDLPNLVSVNTKSQDDNEVSNTSNCQLNSSTVSDDSYNKIKDIVFKKHNLNLSPEFTYSKNTVVPMVSDKLVTSKFFEEKLKGDNIIGCAKDKMEFIEIVDDDNKPESDVVGIDAEKINKANTTTDIISVRNECSQKDDVLSAGQSFRNFIQGIPDSLNISMNTTGYEDADAEFPQCIDSSLLLSPKADDEIQTSDNKVDELSQEVPSFLSGFRKTGFPFFGSASSVNQPESNVQNQNNNFNFTFGGEEKIKRSGLFSMFR